LRFFGSGGAINHPWPFQSIHRFALFKSFNPLAWRPFTVAHFFSRSAPERFNSIRRNFCSTTGGVSFIGSPPKGGFSASSFGVALGFERFDLLLSREFFLQRERCRGGAADFFDLAL
jgi:hypothetical protein